MASTPSNPVGVSMVAITKLALEAGTDRTVQVRWKWSKDHTENFMVRWYYLAGKDWYIGSDSTVDSAYQHNTYTPPDNAVAVKVQIKPVSKTYTKKGKETSHWIASWSTAKRFNFTTGALKQPSTPTVEINGNQVVATLNNINDANASAIWFQIAKIDGLKETFLSKVGKVTIKKTDAVRYSVAVADGFKYKVRCRAVSAGATYKSEWSDWSDAINSKPGATEITTIKARSETYIYLDWKKVESAESYEVQYTTDTRYFAGGSSELHTMTIPKEVWHADVTGLQSGDEYFFRVRSVGASTEITSGWSTVKSCVVGSKPEAPTTWSSTTTATIGEDVYLRWVHNTVDGSNETQAELEIISSNVQTIYKNIIKNPNSEDDEIKIREFKIETADYYEGTTLTWRVRTAGILQNNGEPVWSDWSVQRTIDVYSIPTFTEFSLTDKDGNSIETLTAFPLYVNAIAGPVSQSPIGYHITIIANESYETVDEVGNDVMIAKNTQVYSKYFDNSAITVELTPGSISLVNNISYTVKCVASMGSGLTAETDTEFTVGWVNGTAMSIPNASIGELDMEDYSITITPYCYGMTCYKVTHNASANTYTKTNEVITPSSGSEVEFAFTNTEEQVYIGELANGTEVYYCAVETEDLAENVKLSVYRREFDGTFTEIQNGINNADNITITDLHPALDYARYRIVAQSEVTGEISFYDVTEPLGIKEIILQWDEEVSLFSSDEEAELEEPVKTTQMLKLPYNIDVSNSYKPDVSLIEYIGRANPVSYYGTQRGETATWNAEIAKNDEESLYTLRRLAIWMGDVYVREPSGTGYWANVTVSFNQKHKVLTIPVTLTIARVEGGA